MRDRARKREADRARRARIKAGAWDFPRDGEADLAHAGAPRAPRLASKPVKRQANTEVFTPTSAARPASTAPVPLPSRALTIPTPATPSGLIPAPAPVSMPAIGGQPGRGLIPQGYGYPAPPDIAAVSRFTKWRENMETMVATLAARSDEQERRVKALEAAQAARRADLIAFGQALAGLFSYAVRR